jgi:nuclear polyadenylated RNA-binding protein NAB2
LHRFILQNLLSNLVAAAILVVITPHMAVQLTVGTPLAEALNNAVHTKLLEVGWGSEDDTSLAEFIVLMLVNGKTEDQIASELASDILPEGEGTQEFARWLFEQVQALQNSGTSTTTEAQSKQQSIPSFQDSDESRRLDQQDTPAAYDSDMADGSATAPGNA